MSNRSDRQAGRDEITTERDVRIPVREEEIVVGKDVQEQGRVHVHKDMIEERQTMTVPMQHEQVRVERVPYSGDTGAADRQDLFREGHIKVPVMGEEVLVGKQVKGVEEVRISKDVVTERQQVSDTVRKEQVVVDDERIGNS